MNVGCRSHLAPLDFSVPTVLGTADYVDLVFCIRFVKLHARSSAFKTRGLLNGCCGHGSEAVLGPEYLYAVFISVGHSDN